MLYFHNEGDKVKQGFNFYKLSDKQNFGFKLRIKDTMWQLRYRKDLKYWINRKITITKKDRENFEDFKNEFFNHEPITTREFDEYFRG